MATSNNHKDVKCGIRLNSENSFGHVNSSIVEFNPDIGENSKNFDEARGSSKKGKWSPEEDDMLLRFVEENGTKKGNGKVEVKWGVIARKLNRTYKSCRLRWYNQLAPGISFAPFSAEEDDLIIRMVHEIGLMWSKIAEMLQCRTDNQVKNRWNSTLKKLQKQKLPQKGSSSRVNKISEQGAKSTQGNLNGRHPSPCSNSTLLLISNHTSAAPISQVPLAPLDVLPPCLPDGSLYCHLSPDFDTPDPSVPYGSPDPASAFDWLYSPSLHPPGCELPDVFPGPYACNQTQESQCAPIGGITDLELGASKWEPDDSEPEQPASSLPGFDWLNLQGNK